MRKVSGSRPDGVQDKKGKKAAQEAWVIWRKQRIGEKKRARARNKFSFIHAVSSNYQCIYLIP